MRKVHGNPIPWKLTTATNNVVHYVRKLSRGYEQVCNRVFVYSTVSVDKPVTCFRCISMETQ